MAGSLFQRGEDVKKEGTYIMATVNKRENAPNPGLVSRVAAEKNKLLKMRVAAAWTLSKTMLPTAPEGEQYKFATNLLTNSTQALKTALKQTAINAHYTRLGTQVEAALKTDLNDLLENPSVLTKEESAVTSELKGEAKNATPKKADDRTESGPLPAKYPEPKRNEPDGMDGDHAADRPKEPAEAMKAAASPKKAHSKDCKGCDECDPKKKDDKKAAVVAPKKPAAPVTPVKAAPKKAEADKPKDKDEKKPEAKKEAVLTPAAKAAAVAIATAKAAVAAAKIAIAKAAAPTKMAAPVKKKAEEEAPEEEPADEEPLEDAPEDEAPVDDAPAEGDMPVDDSLEEMPEEGEEEAEPFDEEQADLTDAVEDIKADIETLEEAIADFAGEPEDLTLGEGEMAEPAGELETLGDLDAEAPLEEGAPLSPEGQEQELDLGAIFDEDAMSDKVSSLNDEDEVMEAGWAEEIFGPTDPSDLEAILEQEEGLTSPADMFALDGADNDPLAAMFASVKEASADIVEPGDLQSYFESSHGTDNRDDVTDHDGDIGSDVLESLKQPTRVETRDTSAKLQPPPKGAAVIRRIKQAAPAAKAALNGNLAQLLFVDDPDTN